MDLNKLTTGDRVIGISGIVLLIASFLDWFKAEYQGQDLGSGNAWDFTIAWLAVLIGIAMVVIVLVRAADVNMGDAPWALILLIMGVVAFAFVLIKLIAGVDTGNPLGVDVEVKRQIGLFIGLVASAGLAVGAWLNFQASGGTLPGMGGGSGRGTAPPPGGGGPTV